MHNRELTYEERVKWFLAHHYETGMEYEILLDNMRDDDLDNFKWYDDFIKIPKYFEELAEHEKQYYLDKKNLQYVQVYFMISGDYCAFAEMSFDVVYDVTNNVKVGYNNYDIEDLQNWEREYSDVKLCDAIKDGDKYYVLL